jgi:ABC-type lipoprotein release transport system permease subunit
MENGYTIWGGDGSFLVNIFNHFVIWFETFYRELIVFWKSIHGILIGISIPVSVFLLIVIIYCVEGLKRIRAKEEEIYDKKIELAYDAVDKPDTKMAERWNMVKKLISSSNPSDWKQAIIEADIMLDNLLTNMGYQGETVGEKLKRVEPSEFNTLNEAWEAHKVRNIIAHEGLSYVMSENEAKRVFSQYKKVFEEFYYV